MATITTRAGKGSPLTNTEVDANFTNINSELGQKLTGNQTVTLSGDATGSGATAIAVTLANSGVTAGSYGSSSAIPVITVDAKGRLSNVSTAAVSIPSGSLTFTGDVTGSGNTGSSTALTLANSGATAGTYTKVTVDAKGRVTTGSSLASSDVTTALGFTPYNSSNPSGYITSSSLSSYLPLTGGTLTGQLNIDTGTNLSFGSQTRQMINLWGTQYGIGVQSGTTYFRSASRFSWHRGGSHNDSENNAGGGTVAMTLDSGNSLYVTGNVFNAGNQVLHAGNYTSYSPSLTGSGASGTWGINISGNANTASLAIWSNQYNFTTAGAGWYRVATTGSDGRGTYNVELFCTGGSHNPSLLQICAQGDWGNDKIVYAKWDGNFPANAVRITRGASNTFLEVYFTTTILGATFRINRTGFDTSITPFTGSLPAGGDTVKDTLDITAKINASTLSVSNSTTAIRLASGYHIGMGDWGMRNTTPYGWIQFGPANSSWAHIYADRTFYFNQELYVNNQQVLHSGNYSNYSLPLSGGTLTGSATISGNGNGLYFTGGNNRLYFSGYRAMEGSTNGAQLQIGESYSATYLQSANNYATTSNHVILHAGNYTSTLDGRYLYATSNPSVAGNFTLSIGNNGSYSYVQSHSSQPLELNPVGNTVRIAGNIALHAGNFGSYALPLSGGTLTGTLTGTTGRFQKNQTAGDYTTAALWTESYGNTATGIAFHISGNVGKFLEMRTNGILYWNGDTVIHSGNYNSYALPLSGGTLTGALTINNADLLLNTGGVNTYGLIRGYPNFNHLTTFRANITGSTSTPTYTPGHQMCFVEYAQAGDSTGWFFKSSEPGTYLEVARITRSGINWSGNTVLHAGNYTSYSPSLTGTGASGTWGINITGSHSGTHTSELTAPNMSIGNQGRSSLNAVGGNIGSTTPSWNNSQLEIKNTDAGTVAIALHRAGYTSNTIDVRDGSGIRIDSQFALHAGNFSSYALPLSGGTVTGQVSFTTTSDHAISVGTIRGRAVGSQGGEFIHLYERVHIGSPSGWGSRTAPTYGLSTYGGCALATDTGSVTISGHTALHAGNFTSYAPSINGSQYTEWMHSDRDFPNGTLITTSINYAVSSGDPFVLEIRGNSYGNIVPLDIQYQGYIYYDTIINHGGLSNGYNISGLVALNVGGNLCFWFPSQGYWNGYNVKVYTAYATKAINKVTSITHTSKPSGTKEVGLSANIRQSLHSGNYTSYSPSLTGSGASGTWGISISGTANGLNSSNYIQRSGTSGNLNTDFTNVPAGTVRHAGDDPNVANSPGGTWWFYDHYRHSNGSNYWGTQVAWGWEDNANSLAQRNVSGNNWSGWVRYLNSSNFSSYAVPLGGGTMSGRLTISPGWTTSGRNYSNEWIEFGNHSGLYSPHNSAHFYPNNTEYGSWRIAGSRSGWHGIYFDSGANLMMNSSEVGFHRAGHGWQMWWSGGTGYVHKGNPGGSTQATILDSSNYSSYTIPLGGGWYGSGMPGSRAYGVHVSGGEFVLGNGLPNAGQVGVLIDGAYVAGENNGFWSLPGDSTWGGRRGMYWDGTYLNFTTNSATTRHSAVYCDGNITVSANNATGGGIILADDGDIVDLNDGYCSMRFSYGVRVFSAHRGGSAVHTLHSNGNFTASGNVTAYSDETLKKDWAEIQGGYVEKLASLKCGTYTRIDSGLRQAGVSAQGMREILQEVVGEDDKGILSLAYGNAAMVSAVELAKEIVNLKREIKMMKSKLN